MEDIVCHGRLMPPGRSFGPLHFSRHDLTVLSIMRGRDHGLPDYNTARRHFDLPEVSKWEQINPGLYKTDPQVKITFWPPVVWPTLSPWCNQYDDHSRCLRGLPTYITILWPIWTFIRLDFWSPLHLVLDLFSPRWSWTSLPGLEMLTGIGLRTLIMGEYKAAENSSSNAESR